MLLSDSPLYRWQFRRIRQGYSIGVRLALWMTLNSPSCLQENNEQVCVLKLLDIGLLDLNNFYFKKYPMSPTLIGLSEERHSFGVTADERVTVIGLLSYRTIVGCRWGHADRQFPNPYFLHFTSTARPLQAFLSVVQNYIAPQIFKLWMLESEFRFLPVNEHNSLLLYRNVKNGQLQ